MNLLLLSDSIKGVYLERFVKPLFFLSWPFKTSVALFVISLIVPCAHRNSPSFPVHPSKSHSSLCREFTDLNPRYFNICTETAMELPWILAPLVAWGHEGSGPGFIFNWRNERIVCTCWRIPSENKHSLLLGVIYKRTTILGRREGIRAKIRPI